MQKYLITSRKSYPNLHKQIQKHLPQYVLYRDKSNPDYDNQAQNAVEVCSRFENVKSFIHQKVDLAKELNATGVHLTSKQFSDIEYAKSLGLEVIISTHSHDEVLKAQTLGADAVTYSPIFTSPGKGEAKGIDDLNALLGKCDIQVFALGGVVDALHVESLQETKVFGFASIRYFY